MDFYDRKMIEALMAAAVLLPDLANGGKLKMPQYEVRLRRTGYYALFIDGIYKCTTHETDLDKATRWMNVHALQWLAAQDAVHDVRRVSALAVIEHRKKTALRQELAGAAVICSTLEALADVFDFDEGLQFRHLTDDWAEEAEDKFCETYSYEYCAAARSNRTAASRLSSSARTREIATGRGEDAPVRSASSGSSRSRLRGLSGCMEFPRPRRSRMRATA